MRDLNELKHYAVETGIDGGAYLIRHNPTNVQLRVIASHGGGWDHVSVSLPKRCPNWTEMEFIKRMFFGADEIAMQLHVEPKDHISIHSNCLHIWRPQNAEIPMPPSLMVGPKI